ncbi:hypothetical protein MKW92_006814 [Papaver armeniacum]|nr:hypothetical protein MKW92_006814 [Papaver armeniacum]
MGLSNGNGCSYASSKRGQLSKFARHGAAAAPAKKNKRDMRSIRLLWADQNRSAVIRRDEVEEQDPLQIEQGPLQIVDQGRHPEDPLQIVDQGRHPEDPLQIVEQVE